MVFERYIKNYMREFNQLDREAWNYEDGCVLIGAQAMYEATEDPFFYESIKKYVDRYLDDSGKIKGYDPAEYNIDRIPSGRVFYLLYKHSGEEKYKKAIEILMGQLRTHPRTKCGNFWHKMIYPYQIWLDGLYMGIPFYLLYVNMLHEENQYEDIRNQFFNVRKYLFDDKTQLYYHAFDERKEMFWANKETGLSENFWSRAMGWYFMALADCYELLPESQQDFRRFIQVLLTEAVDGVLKWQDRESGLFYQLTALADVPGNYLETSASAMIAYSILKGVRLGILQEDTYRGKGEEILIGIETRMFIQKNGILQLSQMCKGAGLGPENNRVRDGSITYYLSEEVVSDEQKGSGAAMMVFSEWLRLNKEKGTIPSDYPQVNIWNGRY